MNEDITFHKEDQFIKLSDDPIFNQEIKMNFNPISNKIKELQFENIENHNFSIDEKNDDFFVMTNRFKKQLMKINEIIKCNIPVFIEGPTGTGKTKIIQVLSLNAKKNLIKFHLNAKTQIEDLIGRFQQGPFIDAFVNGKWLLIEEINNASQDILSFIQSALNNKFVSIDNGQNYIEYNKHIQFRLIVTQNTDNLKYIFKQKECIFEQFLSNFKHIQFEEFSKDELFEIATNLNKQFNTKLNLDLETNSELMQNLIDFHYEWSHQPDVIKSFYGFTIRDISDTIQLIKNTNNPLNSIITVYGSRFPNKTRKIMINLINDKYKNLFSEQNNKELIIPSNFPLCFMNKSLIDTIEQVKCAFQNQRHVLLIGKESSGLTHVARLIAKYFSTLIKTKSKNHEYFFVCSPKTTISDLIGKLIPASKFDIDVWKNGPLLKAIKNGENFVLDSLDSAPFEIIEELIELMESENKFKIQENPYESQIDINPKFRLIATANEGNLSSISPALLSKLNVIYLNNQIKKSTKTQLIQFLFNQELDESMKCKVQSDLIDELVNSIDIKKFNMSQISMICKATAKILPYCNDVKSSLIIEFIKNLIDSSCQKFSIPQNLCLIKEFVNSQSYDKEPFYYENSVALKDLLTKIIACSIVGIPVCLKGQAESDKSSLAIAFSENTSNHYQYFSFNEKSTIDDIFGTFDIDNGKPIKLKGPLYQAIEEGQVFISDETNLADDKIIQSLAVALERSSGSKIIVPGLGKSVSFHKKFFFIACQNDGGKELPQIISKKLRIFELSETIDNLKEYCKTIAKLEISNPEAVSQDDAEKLAIFIDKINNSNINHISKWSIKNVRILFKRIFDTSINQHKFIGFTFIHHLLFYVLSGIPDSISNTIFDDIMKILVECFGITDEEKRNLKKCYFENPIIENSEDVKYLKKGDIGVLIPQQIIENTIINYINLHSLWNTLFKILITNDKEPLLISGNSGFKTFLASLILPDAKVVTIHQDTNIDNLFESIVPLHNTKLKEKFYRFLQMIDKYNNILLVLKEKKDLESLNNTETSEGKNCQTHIQNHKKFLSEIGKYLNEKNLQNKKFEEMQKILEKEKCDIQIIDTVKNIEESIIICDDCLTNDVLKQSPLILKDSSNLTSYIFKRIYPNYASDVLYLDNYSNNFRIISLSTSDNVNDLSSITTIACPEYSDTEICDAISSMSLSIFYSLKPAILLKSFTDKYFKEFEENIPFSYLAKILKIIHLFDQCNISDEEKLAITIFRTLCEQSKEVSKKIKIMKILDELFDKNITQTFVSLIINNAYEDKNSFSYKNIDNEKMIISEISKLSIICKRSQDPDNNLYYSKQFVDMADAIFTGIRIHYPVILDGTSGKGKHTAVKYIADIIGYQVVTFRITDETTKEDLLGKIIPKISNNDKSYDFEPSQILQIIKSNSKNKTVIVFEEISQASPSLLNWISSLFDTSKRALLLPNGDIVQKGNYNIIALETNGNKLPKSILNNSIYHSIPEYTNEQINEIALKIFDDGKNLTDDHKTFMDNFHSISSKSNVSELYSLNDINNYHLLTSGILEKVDKPFIQNIILHNKLISHEDISSNDNFYPSFYIKDNKFYSNISLNAKIFIEINENSKQSKITKQDLRSMKSMTLNQRQCLLFLMCSVLKKQVPIISGQSGSGKSFIISNFAKLLNKKLITIQANSQIGISKLIEKRKCDSLFKKEIKAIKNILKELCTDDDLKNEIQPILDVKYHKTWNYIKLKMIAEKAMLSQKKSIFIKSINKLKSILESKLLENSPFIKAMQEGSWILIDNIELAPKEFLEKVISLCSGTQNFNLNESKITIHNDFRLFIIYNTYNIDKSRRISPSILSKYVIFDMYPIDYTAISSGIILNETSNIADEMWGNACARLANVHKLVKKHLKTEITAYSLLYNINIIQNFFTKFNPEIVAKMLCKCLYLNYCNMNKNQVEFYKQLQNELLKEPKSSFLHTLMYYNNKKTLNHYYYNVLRNLYELQINKNKSDFNFQKFLKYIYQYKLQDIYHLSFHVEDTLSHLQSEELMNKFGDLTIINEILNQLKNVSESESLQEINYNELFDDHFLTNQLTKHSLFQIHLLQYLIEKEKLIDFSPSCFCTPNSRKELSMIADLLNNINYQRMFQIIKIILQDPLLHNESNIFLNCEKIRKSEFSKILILLPMLIRLHKNEIPFMINKKNLTSNNVKSDYLVDIQVSKKNFELITNKSRILYQSEKVTINESGFYSSVYHLIDCVENKIPVDFKTNIQNFDYPQINDNNHPLYNLYPNDNQNHILKLFKSAILFGKEIDDNLSNLFGEYELMFMKIFNIVWNTIETDENDLIIKMIDEFIDIEPNIFSLNNYDISTKERLDILASIFHGISEIELFNICEKEAQINQKDYLREPIITILNKIKNEKKMQYYKIEAEKGNIKAMNAYAWMLENGIGVDKNIKEAYRLYQEAADKGSEIAMNNILWGPSDMQDNFFKNMHDHYYELIQHDSKLYNFFDDKNNYYIKNKSKKLSYYKCEADKGNYMAMFLYAKELENEADSEKKKKEVYEYYKKAAEKGVRDAMYRFGQLLEYGEYNATVNKEEACKYYKMAADKGNKDALWKYCNIIRNGECGIPINKEEACRYYKIEADKGNIDALKIYGWMLENGEGVQMNKKEARKCYKKAADKGDKQAIFKYGIMLEYGVCVKEDKDAALKYYKMAKNRRNLHAYHLLKNRIWKYFFNVQNLDDKLKQQCSNENDYYIINNGSDVNNKDDLLIFYEIAARKGDVYAKYKYNWIHEYDELGVDLSNEELYPYYKKFANAGDNFAMYKFGEMLENGEGVQMNKEEACKYYKKAADKGDRNAMYKYAQMCQNGEGVRMNKEEACKYYKEAADKGDRNSMYNYACLLNNTYWDELRRRLFGYENNNEKRNIENNGAFEYYKKAADGGDINAMVKYALLIEEFEIYTHYSDQKMNFLQSCYVDQTRNMKNSLQSLLNEIKKYGKSLKEYVKKVKETNRNKKEITNSTSDNELLRIYKESDEFINEMNQNKKDSFYQEIVRNTIEQNEKKRDSIFCKIREEEYIHKKAISEILTYYKMAADEGDEFAINKIIQNFNDLWENRKNESKDEKDKEKYFKDIKNQLISFYRNNINKIDENMLANNEEFNKIKKFYLKTVNNRQIYYIKADKGSIKAMLDSFNMLLEQGDEISKRKAYSYLKRAADEGDKEAMHEYGLLLFKGEVIKMKKEEACYYFKISGHMGVPDSLFKYGTMCRYGDSTQKNKKEALCHFKIAASENVIEAMYSAGMMLYYSEGVTRNTLLAGENYFLKAASLGHVKSMYQYCVYVDECKSIYDEWVTGLHYANLAYEKRDSSSLEYVKKFSYYILFHDFLVRIDDLIVKFEKLHSYEISEFKSIYNNYFYSYNIASNDYKYIIDNGWTINNERFHINLLNKDNIRDNLTSRMEFIKKYECKVLEYIKYCDGYLLFLEENKTKFEIELSRNNWSAISIIKKEEKIKLQQLSDIKRRYKDLGSGRQLINRDIYDDDKIIKEFEIFSDTLTKSEYETYCNEIYIFLEEKKKKAEHLKVRSSIFEVYEETGRKLEQLSDIKSRYDIYINSKYYHIYFYESKVEKKYIYSNVYREFTEFYDSLSVYIANIDSESISVEYNVKKDVVVKVIESFKTFFDKNQTIKIVKYLFDPKPFSRYYLYSNITIESEYWLSSTIYENPLYSDDHPPIICKDEDEFNMILDNIYRVPEEFEKVLGGITFIKNYSIKIAQVLNQSCLSIHSPHDLGIQLNLDYNSLFCLVISRKIEIIAMELRESYFYIRIKNIDYRSVEFCLHFGTIIALPIGQQPMFIAETWSGTINANETVSRKLKWCCMDHDAGKPFSGHRLTPFIYVVPADKSFEDWPYSHTWWDNIQPDISKKISKSNELWWSVRSERTRIGIIQRPIISGKDQEWNYLPIKNGGIIDNTTFKKLNEYRNDYIKEIDCVVTYLHWADRQNPGKVMIHTNQFALVIKSIHFLIEKTEDGFWEGGFVNGDGPYYKYNRCTYYVDYKSIDCTGIKIGQLINGMRSDPQFYNTATYNSQDSRQFLLGTLGISIPTFHSGSIITPSLRDLIEY